MTKGEYLVGIDFNPSKDNTVAKIKRAAADLIDLVEAIKVPDDPAKLQPSEVGRLKALAITSIENGAMWGVKAATKPGRK
jgi:hypothetical protein